MNNHAAFIPPATNVYSIQKLALKQKSKQNQTRECNLSSINQ